METDPGRVPVNKEVLLGEPFAIPVLVPDYSANIYE
ncbi:hypothetical protein SDC9_71736 [bioreactor metagenome]|uniref:Uncharacterized protein n=1 Tax=bioreactor metagenome TaxID=1076179 RepID=A0A644Y9K6_9ZZZZ